VAPDYKIVSRRAGHIGKIWNDSTFANEELGWKAETALEETLASARKWEMKVWGVD